MAVTINSLATVVRNNAAHFRTRFSSKAHDIDAYFGKLSRATAMSILGFLKIARDLSIDAVPGYGISDLAADLWAYAVGVPSNDAAVKYGRNQAKGSAGGQGTIKGNAGTPIAANTQLTDSTGQQTYKLDAPVVIGAGGTVTGSFSAISKGASTNQPKDAILTWVSPPIGVQSQVTLTVALGGGVDRETTSELVGRLLFRTQNPPRGGAAPDWRRWAENYLDSNGLAPGFVKRAYVYPLRGGTGIVHVVIVGGGSGLSRLLSTGIRDAVKAYLDLVRCTTSQVTVLLPDMSAAGLDLLVKVSPTVERYAFDWSDGGFSQGIVAAANNTITINANVATLAQLATLKDKIDRGLKPRIQIKAANSVLPIVLRATNYTNAAQSVITLESTPSVNILVGDLMYAGGPVCTPVAQELQYLVDGRVYDSTKPNLAPHPGLGPSRKSGYADAFDYWDDTLRINAMIDAAMDAVDPADSRTKMVKDVPTATLNGVAANKQASDQVVGGTPELLWVKSILVLSA